jgi:hypothetical protein
VGVKKINSTPHPALSRKVKRKEKEKSLNESLTLALSREGRGLMKGKEFNSTARFYSLPQGERRKIKRIYLIKSILLVFVNLGVLNV